MSALSILVGGTAALLLIIAGFLIGAKRGRDARTSLAAALVEHEAQVDQLKARIALETSLKGELEMLLNAFRPKPEEKDALREDLERLLAPLIQRELLESELARVSPEGEGRRQLNELLEGIAQTGGLSAVLLSDESGLPIAANQGTDDVASRAGIASIVLLLSDRITRDGGRAARSVLVHDDANRSTLHRIFHVDGQRLLLTAVSAGATLGSASLDPALGRLERALRAR